MYTIYRIENSEGNGPYRSYHSHRLNLLIEHSVPLTHPNNRDDLSGKMLLNQQIKKLYCACPSKQLLYKWFYGWITKLKKENFFVVKITVSNYIMGNSGRQCFFKQEDVISKEII